MAKAFNFIRFFLCFFIVTGFLFFTSILHGSDSENKPRETVTDYFQALKNGDIPELISFMADPLLSENREHLEENTSYSEVLRDYYKDATISIVDTKVTDDSRFCILTAHIFFKSGGNPLKIRFYLKNTNEGWKITHEESVP